MENSHISLELTFDLQTSESQSFKKCSFAQCALNYYSSHVHTIG